MELTGWRDKGRVCKAEFWRGETAKERSSEAYRALSFKQNVDEHMCVRKLLLAVERTSKQIRKKFPGAHIGLGIVLFPSARLENIIHGTLDRVLRKILPQYWGIINPRLNVLL